MRRVSRDFVAKTFGGNDGNFTHNLLVGLEIQRQAGIVFFNDDA